MSAPSVTLGGNPSTLQALLQQRKSDFKALASDVQSGDLSGAQSALAALQRDSASISGLGGVSGAQGSPQSSQLQINFASLINSFQSGSLRGAQSAVGALQPTQATGVAAASGSAQSGFGQELAALIQAVQSGNLTGAQQDLTQLLSDVSNSAGAHRHHRDGGQATSASSGTSGIDSDGIGSRSAASASASAYASMMNPQVSSTAMSTSA